MCVSLPGLSGTRPSCSGNDLLEPYRLPYRGNTSHPKRMRSRIPQCQAVTYHRTTTLHFPARPSSPRRVHGTQTLRSQRYASDMERDELRTPAPPPPEKCLSLIHISEPTRRTPISYAVFCLKKKKKTKQQNKYTQ